MQRSLRRTPLPLPQGMNRRALWTSPPESTSEVSSSASPPRPSIVNTPPRAVVPACVSVSLLFISILQVVCCDLRPPTILTSGIAEQCGLCLLQHPGVQVVFSSDLVLQRCLCKFQSGGRDACAAPFSHCCTHPLGSLLFVLAKALCFKGFCWNVLWLVVMFVGVCDIGLEAVYQTPAYTLLAPCALNFLFAVRPNHPFIYTIELD